MAARRSGFDDAFEGAARARRLSRGADRSPRGAKRSFRGAIVFDHVDDGPRGKVGESDRAVLRDDQKGEASDGESAETSGGFDERAVAGSGFFEPRGAFLVEPHEGGDVVRRAMRRRANFLRRRGALDGLRDSFENFSNFAVEEALVIAAFLSPCDGGAHGPAMPSAGWLTGGENGARGITRGKATGIVTRRAKTRSNGFGRNATRDRPARVALAKILERTLGTFASCVASAQAELRVGDTMKRALFLALCFVIVLGAAGQAGAEKSALVQLYNAPEMNLEEIDRSILDQVGAGGRINFAAYVLSDYTIMDSLRGGAERGAVVRIYLDPRELEKLTLSNDHPLVKLSRTRNVEIKVKAVREGLMHLKSYSVNGVLLRTGSANKFTFRVGTARQRSLGDQRQGDGDGLRS